MRVAKPLNIVFRPDEVKRINSKILATSNEDECWNWDGHIGGGGPSRGCKRPQVKLRNRTMTAARAIFALYYGKLNANQDVHHTCQNPLCVNPRHLANEPSLIHRSEANEPSGN